MKNVLVFVLSAHTDPYADMIRTSMSTWDADAVEGVRTVFYAGQPMQEDTDRLINFAIDEAYATIGHKNLLAYARALTWPDWSYMARVNASCYVHKRRLRDYCQTLPESGLMRGIVSDPSPVCGTTRPFMWGGGQYIFSRDVVQAFVDNGELWNHAVMEDVAMSELAHDLSIPLDNRGRVCSINRSPMGWSVFCYNGNTGGMNFADFAEVRDLTDQFFFRVKQDDDRTMDATVMRLLKKHLPE